MKTLLVPTDFKLQSLNCIPELIEDFYPAKLNIILVHMMQITDDIQELLMLSRRSAEYQHISQSFYNTCASLKRNYSESIHDISIEFFYGSTVVVFKNFLEANQVDAVVLLKNYQYKLLNKNSIEPALLVNRCGKQVVYIDFNLPKAVEIPEPTESLFEQKV